MNKNVNTVNRVGAIGSNAEKEKNKGVLAGLLAPAIWGFLPVALGFVSNYQLGLILFYRIFLSILILFFVIFIFRQKRFLQDLYFIKSATFKKYKKFWLGLFISGAAMGMNWTSFLYVVQNVNVKSAALAYLLAPLLTALLAVFIHQESLKKEQKIAVTILCFSCVLLSLNYGLEVFFAVAVAFFYALFVVFQKWILMLDRWTVLLFNLIIAFLVVLLFLDFNSFYVPTEILFWNISLILVFVFTLLPLFLNVYANARIPSSLVGILIYINPFISFSLAVFYFKESFSSQAWFAYSLIFLAVILFNLQLIQRLIKK